MRSVYRSRGFSVAYAKAKRCKALAHKTPRAFPVTPLFRCGSRAAFSPLRYRSERRIFMPGIKRPHRHLDDECRHPQQAGSSEPHLHYIPNSVVPKLNIQNFAETHGVKNLLATAAATPTERERPFVAAPSRQRNGAKQSAIRRSARAASVYSAATRQRKNDQRKVADFSDFCMRHMCC